MALGKNVGGNLIFDFGYTCIGYLQTLPLSPMLRRLAVRAARVVHASCSSHAIRSQPPAPPHAALYRDSCSGASRAGASDSSSVAARRCAPLLPPLPPPLAPALASATGPSISSRAAFGRRLLASAVQLPLRRQRRPPERPKLLVLQSYLQGPGRLSVVDRKPMLTLSTISQQTLAKSCGSSRLCAEAYRRTLLAARSHALATLGYVLDTPLRLLRWVLASVDRAIHLLGRVGYLLLIISPLAFAWPVLGMQHRLMSAAAVDGGGLAHRVWGRMIGRLSRAWWDYFEVAVQSCGPTCIKLMQWAAARPDLFPEELCRRLSNVHSFVTVPSWMHTAPALDQALGGGWQDFLEVDSAPIGSGCMATVYRGKLLRQPRKIVGRVKAWRWFKRTFGRYSHPHVCHMPYTHFPYISPITRFVFSIS